MKVSEQTKVEERRMRNLSKKGLDENGVTNKHINIRGKVVERKLYNPLA